MHQSRREPDPSSPADAVAQQLPELIRRSLPREWGLPQQRRVVVALIEAGLWQPWRDEAQSLLAADEAQRMRRRRFRADRDLLVIAYALHRLVLGVMLDRQPQDVPLYRDARGCPRLAGGTVHTSLSHADGVIALAVTCAGPVGVDIEPMARAAEMPPIAQHVCHPSEAATLAGLDPVARAAALLRLWVRKEALLKAAGVGLAVEMDTFIAPSAGVITLPPTACPTQAPMQVRMLDAGRGCVAAVAAPPGTHAQCQWLQPCPDAPSSDARLDPFWLSGP